MIHVMMKFNNIKIKCFKIINILSIHKLRLLKKEIAENKLSHVHKRNSILHFYGH